MAASLESLTPPGPKVYFRHAVLSACHSISERSIENVQVLLLQCFYLLTTCQTDRYVPRTLQYAAI